MIIAVVIAEVGDPERPRPLVCNIPTVYVPDNFRGPPLQIRIADPDLHNEGGKYGDSVSSICVPSGWTVRAFEHKVYKGKRLEIIGPKQYEDLKRQLDFNWGDKISSIAAFRNR